MKRRLSAFRRKHFETKRVLKALAIAIPTILVGNWLLQFWVENLGFDPVWAYRTNWPIMTFLCFVLNRTITWSDRKRTSVVKSLVKWVMVSLAHSAINQALYPVLVGNGIHYIVASVLLLALSPVYFVINNWVTFRDQKTEKA